MSQATQKTDWTHHISGDLRTKIKAISSIASEPMGQHPSIDLAWGANYVDTRGRKYAFPEFRVYDRWEADSVVLALSEKGYTAAKSMYVDDDGDDDNGRPITIYKWTVTMVELMIESNIGIDERGSVTRSFSELVPILD